MMKKGMDKEQRSPPVLTPYFVTSYHPKMNNFPLCGLSYGEMEENKYLNPFSHL